LDKNTNDECSAPSGIREGNAVHRHNSTPNTGSKIKKQVLVMNVGAYVKESETSNAPTYASLLSYLTFQKTAKSHMEKLFVITNQIRLKNNESD
jgi:hypothetical protein